MDKDSDSIMRDTNLEIYLKAGLSKEEVLKKIENSITDKNRERVLKIVEEHFEKKNRRLYSKIGAVAFLVIIFIIVISISVYLVFIKDSVFYSENCSEDTIAISIIGGLERREEAVKVLKLVEESNCEYFLFIADNAKTINVGDPGILSSGVYRNQKDAIQIDAFSGSPYWKASVIIHEACHSFQDKNNREFSEHECMQTTSNFLKKIDAPGEDMDRFERAASSWPGYSVSGEDVFAIWKENRLSEFN